MTGFATGFLEQLDAADFHEAINGLTHVVNREKPNLHGGESFHFHTRLPSRFAGCNASHGALCLVKLEINGHARERNRMTQRDQVRRLFARHNGRHAGNADHIALFGRSLRDHGKGFGLHTDVALRTRHAMRLILGADVNHMRVAGLVKMSEFCHLS